MTTSDRDVVNGASEDGEEDDGEGDVVQSATVLGFGPGPAAVVRTEKLDEIVPAWSGDLFPKLVTANTNAVRPIVETLATRIAGLRGPRS